MQNSYKRATLKLMKTPTSFRLTKEAQTLLAALASKDGISRAAVLELLVRRESRERGIAITQEKPK